MNSLHVFIFCLSALGVFGSELTLEERENAVWGDYSETEVVEEVVSWSDEDIAHLRLLLNNAISPIPALNDNFEYGFNPAIMSTYADYWANTYNFTERMEYMNDYNHYVVPAQGLKVHVVVSKAEETTNCTIVPLVLLHGYPSTWLEYRQMIDELSSYNCANGIGVDVVAVNMVGTISDAPNKPGCGSAEIATIIKIVMEKLGYTKFFVESNDCTRVDSMLATLYPEVVLGLHTVNPFILTPKALFMWFVEAIANTNEPFLTKMAGLLNGVFNFVHFLVGQPDTMGVALANSPTGMLAHIGAMASTMNRPYNKYLRDGGISAQFDENILFDEACLHWFAKTFSASGRIFSESFSLRTIFDGLYMQPTSVPTLALITEYTPFKHTPAQIQTKFENLIGTEYMEAGHYPAYEMPAETTKSLMNFIEQVMAWRTENDMTL